ncbi:MAG: lytic transglycosylase domain-containing protein [Thermoleophilia bacterium]
MRRLLLLAVVVAVAAAAGLGVLRCAGASFTAEPAAGWYSRLAYPLEHDGAIRTAARRQHLDPALVAAVISTESGFDERAVSSSGAVGLMQVLPATAAQIARETGGVAFEAADLEDPRVNVRYGSYYLRRLLDEFGGDTLAAVAAYNAGAARVAVWLDDAAADGRRLRTADIPFPETREYVRRVLERRRLYRELYGDRLRRAS